MAKKSIGMDGIEEIDRVHLGNHEERFQNLALLVDLDPADTERSFGENRVYSETKATSTRTT